VNIPLPTKPMLLFVELRTVMNPVNAMLASEKAPDLSHIKGNKKPTTLGALGWTVLEVFVGYNRKPPKPQKTDDELEKRKRKTEEKASEEEDTSVGKPFLEPYIKSGRFALPVFQGQLTKRMVEGLINMNNHLEKDVKDKPPLKSLAEAFREVSTNQPKL
jgi:hypothetical protein